MSPPLDFVGMLLLIAGIALSIVQADSADCSSRELIIGAGCHAACIIAFVVWAQPVVGKLWGTPHLKLPARA